MLSRWRKEVREGVINARVKMDQIWAGDVTYLKVGSSSRFMATVVDRHSRRVLGYKIGRHRDLDLTIGALDRARSRRPRAEGVIFHSDRGSEYAGYRYQDRLAKWVFTQSMKRPARLGDTAHIESFFHTKKSAVTHGVVFEDDASLIQTISKYIRRSTSPGCIPYRLHVAH